MSATCRFIEAKVYANANTAGTAEAEGAYRENANDAAETRVEF